MKFDNMMYIDVGLHFLRHILNQFYHFSETMTVSTFANKRDRFVVETF